MITNVQRYREAISQHWRARVIAGEYHRTNTTTGSMTTGQNDCPSLARRSICLDTESTSNVDAMLG